MKNESLIYPGMRVVVMGLGVTGRAAVRYCQHLGAEVYVSDSRTQERFLAEEGELLDSSDVQWEAGGHSKEFLGRADLLLPSPGVDLAVPLIKSLKDNGIRIAGELAVAAGKIDMPVVAVTGTNGKTTVTTLIGEILASGGKRVFVGGNIGTPLYEYLLNPGEYDIVVVEVSSFQLESAGIFSPDVALLLNISPDHLDRHHTMERYSQAKMQLFKHQLSGAVAVLNGDDQICRQLASGIPSRVYSFGTDDQCTAIIKNSGIILNLDGSKEEYCFDDLGHQSGLTLKNYAAAIIAVRSLGCTYQDTKDALHDFRPLPHRIEFVAEVKGVAYYNDSKATNTGAVIGALEQFDDNVILLAGGRDKGDDYRLLRDSVRAKVKKLFLLGESSGLLQDALGDLVAHDRVKSMEEAVRQAALEAKPGDAVLLSPACASFDMFSSYAHRGNVFKEAVLALKNN